MRVVVMGLGRLGGSLVQLLPEAGVEVSGWRRGQPVPSGDVAWICVRDDAIAEVAARVPASMPVLHASGALGVDVLAGHAERGVLHPLMTFPGATLHLPNLRGVAARIDGTAGAKAVATQIAAALGMIPLEVSGDVRAYHAAAVLASNHVAAVFADAALTLSRAGVPPAAARAALLRLAHESLDRVAENGASAITGPAARGDVRTMDGHRAVLDPEAVAAYDAIAARIVTLRAPGRLGPSSR